MITKTCFKTLTTVAFFIFFFLPLVSFGGETIIGWKWKTQNTPHFSIHYPEHIEVEAGRVSKSLERYYAYLSKKYDWYPRGRIHVILDDREQVEMAWAAPIPYNTIHLNSTLGETDLVISHELSHVIQLDAVRGVPKFLRHIFGRAIVPLWFSPPWYGEGMASYEETLLNFQGRGRDPWAEIFIVILTLEGGLPPIDKIDGYHTDLPSYMMPYIFGQKFLEYLAQEYGEDKVISYLHQSSRTIIPYCWNKRAVRVFGKDLGELWDEFRQDLTLKYQGETAELVKNSYHVGEEVFSRKKSLIFPAPTPREGTTIYFTTLSTDMLNQIRSLDSKTGATKVLYEEGANPKYSNITIEDVWGETLLVSALDVGGLPFLSVRKRYLYLFDVKKKKFAKIAGSDWVTAATFGNTKDQIWYATYRHRGYTLFFGDNGNVSQVKSGPDIRIEAMNYNPSRQLLAVEMHPEGSAHHLSILNNRGMEKGRISSTGIYHIQPRWDKGGDRLYFTVIEKVIPNIYYAETGFYRVTGAPAAIGVYPVPLDELYYITLHRDRETFVRLKKEEKPVVAGIVSAKNDPNDLPPIKLDDTSFETSPPKSYGGFPQILLPRMWIPTFNYSYNDGGDDWSLGIITYHSDPLAFHNWQLSATFNHWYGRNYAEASFDYTFAQFFNLGSDLYVKNYGDLLSSDATRFVESTTDNYLERHLTGRWGIDTNYSNFNFALWHFLDKSWSMSSIPETHIDYTASFPTQAFIPREGYLSGFLGNFGYSTLRVTGFDSIGTDRGFSADLMFEASHDFMGTTRGLERDVALLRYTTLSRPFLNHVLGFDAMIGSSLNQSVFPGVYAMGGSSTNEDIVGRWEIPFRGIPASEVSGDSVYKLTASYRLPIISPQRGHSTWPVFLRHLTVEYETEYGRVFENSEHDWSHPFENDILGIGLGLGFHTILGYYFPFRLQVFGNWPAIRPAGVDAEWVSVRMTMNL